ncbi:MAG: beta-lactamase family protein [Bacteroidales bacterium]|nr:beta-lactamase family protein [Candidatus Cryptobacteroides caccocaballi]
MQKWELKGACVAVMRNDSLVFAKGYGKADEGVPMQPNHLMRVASVSKLITAVGIMNLVDQGMLSLSDPVFGEDGILVGPAYENASKDPNYAKITVEHLLRHQGGFATDPMFAASTVRQSLGLSRKPLADDYIRYGLSKKVLYRPGDTHRYSNFGYLLLSRIIEVIGDTDYETYIDRNILEPIGCNDMHIAGNEYVDRFPGEVRYYSHDVSKNSYGDNDITVLSGAGGWCCSVLELAKLIASIDGRPEVEDVISSYSVEEMTAYHAPEWYSLGWNDTNPEKGWTRTGTFTGTSALIKYFPDGECWIFVTNTSTWRGPRLATATAELFDECRLRYSSKFPRRNMFYY